MTESILVAYATRNGSTQEVADRITATLREQGLDVDLKPAREVKTLAGYRIVVLGAPLYAFHWHKDALNFLSRHRQALTEMPVAIFALGPLHDDAQERQEARAQLDKELAKFPWLAPDTIEMFGGKLDPTQLQFPESLFMGKLPASDVRDWVAIRAWALGLVEKFELASGETRLEAQQVG